MGAIEGEAIGQTVGGQIGARSSALLHRGCIWPFTHWQMHPACACGAISGTPTIVMIQSI